MAETVDTGGTGGSNEGIPDGSLIDVFTVGPSGQPSDTFTANPAGVPAPFGFTFDDQEHLVVTDAATSTLTTYTVHSDGTVKQVASQPNGQQAMCWVAALT